jgi:uncharacterized membrane protein
VAWIFLGISATIIAGRWLSSRGRVPVLSPRNSAIISVIVVCLLFALPFVVQYNAGYGTGTLDGLAYLSTTHPGDAGGVAYLMALPGAEVIVEAEGGPYSYYSRISSFTGIPTIIGWSNHEGGWRSKNNQWYFDNVASRITDIRDIYEQSDQTVPLMKKYNATLLYVGDPERERYNVTLPAVGLEKIYSSRGTDIYRLSG